MRVAERPTVRFAVGAFVGAVTSLSVSFGLMALIAMIALALIFGFAARSHAVVSGVLSGFGIVWLVLVGTNYMRCVAMGTDCGGSENLVPFLIIAGVAFGTGVAVGLRATARHRATLHSPRRGAA